MRSLGEDVQWFTWPHGREVVHSSTARAMPYVLQQVPLPATGQLFLCNCPVSTHCTEYPYGMLRLCVYSEVGGPQGERSAQCVRLGGREEGGYPVWWCSKRLHTTFAAHPFVSWLVVVTSRCSLTLGH